MSLKRTMSDPSSVPQTVERKIHLNVGGTRYITTDRLVVGGRGRSGGLLVERAPLLSTPSL